jgi:hypothetical protein
MVMVLLRGICRPHPQYLVISVTEAKCTHLGFRTRLSWPYTLDPPLALAFLRSNHSATAYPKQDNNQGSQIAVGTSCRPACDRIAQLEPRTKQGK